MKVTHGDNPLRQDAWHARGSGFVLTPLYPSESSEAWVRVREPLAGPEGLLEDPATS